MRYLIILAAFSICFLSPGRASTSSPQWEPATAMTVTAGLNSRSTFVIQADVELPQSCYAAQIHQVRLDPKSAPYYLVEQQRVTTQPCTHVILKCSVVSATFGPPSPLQVLVKSKGPKEWNLKVNPTAPKPGRAACPKVAR